MNQLPLPSDWARSVTSLRDPVAELDQIARDKLDARVEIRGVLERLAEKHQIHVHPINKAMQGYAEDMLDVLTDEVVRALNRESVRPRAWIWVLTAIYEVRSRRKIWKKLAELTRDEQAVMYVLHMEQRHMFKAGNDSSVARKLGLAELVEYGDASGTRWTLYRVPTRVSEVSVGFVDAWAQALASRGFTTQPALRALVGRILDHNPL